MPSRMLFLCIACVEILFKVALFFRRGEMLLPSRLYSGRFLAGAHALVSGAFFGTSDGLIIFLRTSIVVAQGIKAGAAGSEVVTAGMTFVMRAEMEMGVPAQACHRSKGTTSIRRDGRLVQTTSIRRDGRLVMHGVILDRRNFSKSRDDGTLQPSGATMLNWGKAGAVPFIHGFLGVLVVFVALGFRVVLGGHSGCRHAMAHPLEEAAHAGIEVLFVCFHCFFVFLVWGTSLFR